MRKQLRTDWQEWLAYGALVPALSLLAVLAVEHPLLAADDMTAQWDWLLKALPLYLIYIIGLKGLFLRNEALVRKASAMPVYALLLAGGWQALLGLLQVYGFEASNHARYALTGSFFNPGPYAGFLAVVFPLALHEVLHMPTGRSGKVWKALAWTVGLLILCTLPATRSRAAWVAVACSALLVFGLHRYRQYVRWWLPGLAGLALLGAFGSSFLNEGSANGRLLIWKVCIRAVADSPLTGHAGTFSGVYGRYQEEYFASGLGTEAEKWVAGAPDYAFNEYVQAMVQIGVPATLCIVLFFLYLCRMAYRGQAYGTVGAWVALAVFAGFSYPFHFPAFWVVVVLLVVHTGMGMQSRRILWAMGLLAIGIGAGCAAAGTRLSGWQDFYKAWADARLLYRTHAYREAADAYKACESHRYQTGRADFWFEYGHSLYKSGQYEAAIRVLGEAGKRSADPMTLNILGECYEQWNGYPHHLERAEEYYVRSIHRLPLRLYPYYLLAKLYAHPEVEQVQRMCAVAMMVLAQKPKVESPAVDDMKREMKLLLEKTIK